MSKRKFRVFTRAFKLAAVRRMLAGENVSALSRELQVLRKDLYLWRDRFRAGGPEALRARGRPQKQETIGATKRTAPQPHVFEELEAARKRIAELERKIGQQQVDLDFFRQALRQVTDVRRSTNRSGATASTRSSRR
jgi:transposase